MTFRPKVPNVEAVQYDGNNWEELLKFCPQAVTRFKWVDSHHHLGLVHEPWLGDRQIVFRDWIVATLRTKPMLFGGGEELVHDRYQVLSDREMTELYEATA